MTAHEHMPQIVDDSVDITNSVESKAADNPGSYLEFITREGLSPGPEAILAHSIALDGFKITLARQRGIHPDNLHTAQINYHSTEEAVA